MVALDLIARAEAAVSPDDMVARLFDMACVAANAAAPHDPNRAGSNGGRISWDSCGCAGCAAVRRYVAAKLYARHVERKLDGGPDSRGVLGDAQRRVRATQAEKDRVLRELATSPLCS